MNLELNPGQRQLVSTVRKQAAGASVHASGWEVFDSLGLTTLLTRPSDASLSWGLLEWCLVFEELGSHLRDLNLIRSARTFLDVFIGRRGDDVNVRETFGSWARQHRSDSADADMSLRRTRRGESVAWSVVGSRLLSQIPDAVLTAREAVAVDDRDLVACAAYAVGLGQRCLALAQERAAGRLIAGKRLLEHQGPSHRLANVAIELAGARIAVWEAAWHEDVRGPVAHRAEAAAAAAVDAVLACARELVQMFGAAGTSDPTVVGLYRAAYAMIDVCSSPRRLRQSAGARWAAVARLDAATAM